MQRLAVSGPSTGSPEISLTCDTTTFPRRWKTVSILRTRSALADRASLSRLQFLTVCQRNDKDGLDLPGRKPTMSNLTPQSHSTEPTGFIAPHLGHSIYLTQV